MLMLEPKDHPKEKVPDVQTVVKARLGNDYFESIILNGRPAFLCNINGKVQTLERFTHNDTIYEPIPKDCCGYAEYEYTKKEIDFFKDKSADKQYLLNKAWQITNIFIDASDIVKTLITVDLVLSYCLEWIDSVHYLYFVGETESGKSTALHLFKNLGFRCLYSNGLGHANIYNFYGNAEEACGIICEDECQDLWRHPDKIATYKNSYTRGSIKPIILLTSNMKKQIFYKTFGLKLFAGENIPHDKGFMERLAIVHMVEGTPEGNIKRPTEKEKETLRTLRLGMLYWKVSNIHDGLPQVESGLKNRDAELWDDFHRVAKDTDFEERTKKVVDFYTKQRHEAIWNSLDAKLFKLVLNQLNEYRVKAGRFWNNLTTEQDEIPGELKDRLFYPNEFNKPISRNYISSIFIDKFGAKKQTIRKKVERKIQQTVEYVFDPKILERLANKYHLEDTLESGGHSGHSGHSGHTLGVYSDDHDDHDDHSEVSQ